MRAFEQSIRESEGGRCDWGRWAVALCASAALLGLSFQVQAQNEFEFAPETVEKSGPPSKTMQKALKLYENRDYYSASIELHKVIEGETGDSEPHKQRATFWMGKTLYNLKFYSAALSYFDRIVQTGEGHRYHGATLRWLAALSRQLPESVGILKKVGKYTRSQLEQPALEKVRNELYYLLGRYHYGAGNFKDAIALFSGVPANSPFFARSKFMEGITYVRTYKARPAAEAFRTLLRTAREAPETNEIRDFKELALVSLARVFYSTGQHDLSIKYYDQLPQESIHWLDSLFESAWAHFQRNHFSKTLGNIHTLNAPYFKEQFYPESWVLKAVVYWKHCLWTRSQEAIDDFKRIYPALKKAIDGLAVQYKDPTEFYAYANKIREGSSGLAGDVGQLARSALLDRTLQKSFRYVEELDRELQQVQNADPAWKATAVAGVVLQDLTLQRSLAERDAGELAQRRLKRLSDEIRQLLKQSIKVEYEIINGQKNEFEAAVRNELVVPEGAVRAKDIHIDDEHQYWPFTGEYWRDELGYYRYKIASRCTR